MNSSLSSILNNFVNHSVYDDYMEIHNDKDKFKLALRECLDYLQGVYETMPASNNEYSTMKKVMNFIESLEDFAYYKAEASQTEDDIRERLKSNNEYYINSINEYRKRIDELIAENNKYKCKKWSLLHGWVKEE